MSRNSHHRPGLTLYYPGQYLFFALRIVVVGLAPELLGQAGRLPDQIAINDDFPLVFDLHPLH